ncbi:threonylcarbamoyl-AMP synthase [Candidatus Peribacteria bacterium]|jgi:L-threonylcarbamoyladenylate synthase|nr:threonylcarbamoyl-AMP synthase [Candidatus Peribacteria bacterium]MBT4021431.1 threonylcarbamoyl-AMP synthase [Candidatus Peribacteria bacterium]MBT4240447.1 threonylcarbamoyl-AMP synthase [Candidatus Peribacteria bacterium]MBT4474529.1 threonylcarbamoyl-AMP synthase [Candidatus Peribacteria bacterium]
MRLVSDSNIQEAVEIILSGGVVAHATETCYGLACDLGNDEAVAKLFAIKERPEGMPVSALFASIEDVKKYVEWNDVAEELASKYLPGPLTIILPIASKSETIGVRVSSNSIASKLAELSAIPISTTSANLHGEPEIYSGKEVLEKFENKEFQPDLILDSGVIPKSSPSTVLKISDGNIEILRQGSISV